MDKLILRRYLPAILLTVGIMLVWSTRSQSSVQLVGPLQSVLPSYPDYRVTAQKVSDEERKVAGMSDYVARAFWRGDTVAFTSYVGYYDRQTQGKTIHSPRNCLPGAGWEVMAPDTSSIMAGGKRHVINKYILKNGPVQALVYYWYQGRGRVVASEYTVKWNLLRDAAFEGHTEEALVRVVVFIHPDQKGRIAPDRIASANTLGLGVATQLLSDVQRVLPGDADASRNASVAQAAKSGI